MSIFTRFKKQSLLLLAAGMFCGTASAQWSQSSSYSGTIYSLVSNDSIIWAGTDTGGVIRSDNNGVGWFPVNNGISNNMIKALARRGGRMIAASADLAGAFRVSDNNGDSWAQPANNYFGYVFSLLVDGSTIYAGTWYGVSKSVNNGESWSTLGQTGLPSNASVGSLAVIGSNIFAGVTASGGGGTGVYMSNNGGSSWTARNNGLTNTNITALLAMNGNLYAGTATGVFMSVDNGSNWTPMNNGMTSNAILALQNINGHLVAGTSLGVFRWNGTSWTNISGNLTPNSQVYSIVKHGTSMFIGTSNGIYTSSLTILGVEDASQVSFNVYPNPGAGVFRIVMDKEVSSAKVCILNAVGSEVHNSSVSGDQFELDLAHLSKGLYIVQISSGNALIQKKIVIQ